MLYLHIGLHKTATTAIQKFLFKNKGLLKKEGFLYPVSTLWLNGNAHLLARSLNKKHPNHQGMNPEKIWKEIEKEIFQEKCEKVILSSEDLSIQHIDLQLLSNLLKSFKVKVMVYIRRQDDLVQSQYNTLVKQADKRVSIKIQKFVNKKFEFLDFRKKIDKWAEAFGKENLIIRVYEKMNSNDSLFDDFMSCMGLSLNSDYSIPGRTNPSLATELIELLRMFNEIPMDKSQHQKLVRSLEQYSIKIKETGFLKNQKLLSPTERIKLLKLYEEDNQFIAREYLGREDGRLFLEPWPDSDELWDPGLGLTKEQMTRIITDIWLKENSKDTKPGLYALNQCQSYPISVILNALYNKILHKLRF